MPINSPTWDDTIEEAPSWDTTSEHVEETPKWDDTSEHVEPIGQLPASPFGANLQSPQDLATTTVTGQPDIPSQETALSANMKEETFRPEFTIPEWKVNPDDSRTVAIGKQAVNVLKSVPEFFTSPGGAAAIPAALLFPTVTAGAFTADLLHSLGSQIKDAYKNWDQMTPAQQGVAIANMIGTGAFAGLGAKGTFKGVEAKALEYAPRGAGVASSALIPIAPTPKRREDLLNNRVPRGTGIGGEEPVEPPSIVNKEPGAPLEIVQPPKETSPAAPVAPTGEFIPALKTKEGEIIPGELDKVHDDIYKSMGMEGAQLLLSDNPPQRGFVKDGKFYTREEVAKEFGETEPMQSERLRELQQERRATNEKEKGQEKVVLAEEQGPEIIGMGGAAAGEIPESGLGKEIYGIAQRVREERARAGQVIEVEPGTGTTAPDSIAHGRELLINDPTIADKALSTFKADPQKSISADGVAAVRAKGEQLALAARRAEEKFGTNSDEFHRAWVELSKWDTETKPMQTEWSKIGQAQQGRTDIDTGSFTGLQQAYRDIADKDFTPAQTVKAKEVAGKVAKSAAEADKANAVYSEALKAELKASRERTDAEQRAIDAANKTVREWAARRAEAEEKKAVAEGALKTATDKLSRAPDEAAKKAADKTVRETAIRKAKEEGKKAVAEAKRNLEIAELERKTTQKALGAANKTVREAAIRRAKQEQKYADNPRLKVLEQAKKYLDQGLDNFNDIRVKVATDLNMPVEKVTKLLAQKDRLKTLADDLYVKQQNYRRFDESAKRWLQSTQVPLLNRALRSIPRAMFAAKVGFHGTVALGTHAPALPFQPRFWGNYIQNFGKMYKLVGSKAYYETQIQDLIRRPNYARARQAGLVNDPFTYEDFNNPEMAKYFGNLTGMGNRGYTVLKILRQDLFDRHWNALPQTLRSPKMAELLSDTTNHVTGVTKGMSPKGANVLLFAPRLLASRAMWLVGDPVKAASIVANWKNASREEKYFATNQLKEKLWVAGTYFSLLALNQALLNETGSKQKINGIPESMGGKGFDPMKADFMKFKAEGMQGSYGNAMITAARLPIRIYATASGPGGKMRKLVYPDEDTAKILFEYARSQASPFAGTIADLILRADFQNRPLPHSERPMPKRLRERGVQPYTWTEYITQQAAPIPIQEGLKEVWGQGFGMSDEQIDHYLRSLAIIALMSGTGGRLTEDWDVSRPITATETPNP